MSIAFWCATWRAPGRWTWLDLRAGTARAAIRLSDDNVRYWIATAPVGAASVLAEELAQFGASDIRERSHDVKFQGTLEVGYRACLWSRAATRVLLSVGIDRGRQLGRHLFEAIKRIDWREHLAPGATLACDCSGGNRIDPPHDLRLATAEGRGLRQPARGDRRAAEHRPGAARRAACTCTSRAPRRWCPWISPARACTGAAIASRAAARRSRKTSRRRCCCARAGRRICERAGCWSIPCADRAPF